MEGDAAGFDRLRAERETLNVETDLVIATTDRARAQATLASFFAEGPTRRTRGRRGPRGRTESPGWRPCSSKPIRFAASYARFNMKSMQLALLPAPLNAGGRQNRKSSPARSPRRSARELGSVIMVHATIPLFDQARPDVAVAEARARQAEARAEAFRVDSTRPAQRSS